MNTARYLNVDCILRSDKSLSKLLLLLQDNIFLLWNEIDTNGSFVGFETNLIDTSGPEEDIAEFLRLFDIPEVKRAIHNCKEKVLDIGFESGDTGEPVDVVINSDFIDKVSELGFSIKIRIYPVPPDE